VRVEVQHLLRAGTSERGSVFSRVIDGGPRDHVSA
jgi:hypothetical protein